MSKSNGYNTEIVSRYFREHGLPPVESEYKFHPTRRWRFDFAFLREKVALENSAKSL